METHRLKPVLLKKEPEIVRDRNYLSRREVLYRLGFLGGSGGLVFAARDVFAQPALKKLTYAVATADLNVGYPFATLAKALGYYEQEGLDVEIVPGQSSATVAQLLLSGRADIGLAQPDPVVIQRANNRIPLVSFYAVC